MAKFLFSAFADEASADILEQIAACDDRNKAACAHQNIQHNKFLISISNPHPA